jgi:HAD superfamily hydrolase (TIGR01509 family)
MSVVQADFLRLTGGDLKEDFEADFLKRLFAAYRRDLSAMEGVRELIEALDVPYCMATSSSMERATVSLEVTGLLSLFAGKIFSSSMVARGKPAPDLFLHAAEKMGIAPVSALVIEDSEVGVLAAQRAGMTVWRFVGGSHFNDAPDAATATDEGVPVFRSMHRLAAELRTT